jgi:hypothetical protein
MPAWLNRLQRLLPRAIQLQGSILACCIFFSPIYIYNKGIRLCLNTFITILIKSLRIPCGMVHGIHMDCSMWTGAWIPYGIVHGFSIKIHWKFHGFHMESIWTVHGPVHGMHHSMYSPCGIHSGYGLTKWLGTQPKNSPYGIHGLGGGIHPVHMESIWNHPGSVKTSFVKSTETHNKKIDIISLGKARIS